MAERFEQLLGKHIEFIDAQHMFFVGTAGAEGYVNVSPKGLDSFKVLDEKRVAWLNLTGSGNESAAHVLENGRMTIMFCSFDKQPLILRLYGQARAVHHRDEDWSVLSGLFPEHRGRRQVFVVDLELVQTSCGYAVPFYEFSQERPTLAKWMEQHDADGMENYWRAKNTRSLDDRPTGLFEESGHESAEAKHSKEER